MAAVPIASPRLLMFLACPVHEKASAVREMGCKVRRRAEPTGRGPCQRLLRKVGDGPDIVDSRVVEDDGCSRRGGTSPPS